MGRVAVVVGLVVVVCVVLAMFMHVLPVWSSGGGVATYTRTQSFATTSRAPASYPYLTNYSGTAIQCLGGEEVARELWARMRDFEASDPRIEPYVNWLDRAVYRPWTAMRVPGYPHGYRWFDSQRGVFLILPDPYEPVRIGVVRLPFGAGIVVTAYQDINRKINIVVHGTILNGTEWRKLLARVGTFMGGLDAESRNVTVQWVLWRVALEGRGSYLVTSDGERIPIQEVVVLLEMPAYTVDGRYWYEAEAAYWDIVGHPALALAIRLAYPENTDALSLYTKVVEKLTRRVVLTGVTHPGNVDETKYGTPFMIRSSGRGVCNEQSRATSLFASNALGAYTAYVGVGGDHAISVIMYTGLNRVDTDGDGKPDAMVLIDTADLPISYINKNIDSVRYEPPLLYVDPYRWSEVVRYGYFWSGIVDSVLSLPDWLKAPWLGYAVERSNFSEIEEEAWGNVDGFVSGLKRLGGVREAVRRLMNGSVFVVPPSVALALGKVLNSLPTVYEAGTPSLSRFAIVWGAVEVRGSGTYFKGSGTVGGDNVTVVISYRPTGYVGYNVTVYVNGEVAYRRWVQGFLPHRLHLGFLYGGRAYSITVVVRGRIASGGYEGAEHLPGAVTLVFNATWNGLAYRVDTTVNGTRLVVLVWKTSWGEWVADVWIGDRCVYSGPVMQIHDSTATIYFTWNGTRYRLVVHLAENEK